MYMYSVMHCIDIWPLCSEKTLHRGFNKSRLPAAVYHHLLTAVCLDFINENKNDINKKKQIQQQQGPLKILKCYKNSILSDAQNAGNRISKLVL